MIVKPYFNSVALRIINRCVSAEQSLQVPGFFLTRKTLNDVTSVPHLLINKNRIYVTIMTVKGLQIDSL